MPLEAIFLDKPSSAYLESHLAFFSMALQSYLIPQVSLKKQQFEQVILGRTI